MGMPGLIYNRTEGGLGRPLPNNDHISGLIFYHDSLPSGFGSSDRIKKIFSVEDAENLGIVDDYSDETKATGGSVQITTPGSAGDTATVTLDTAVLGTYTVITSDTADDVATGLGAAVNALTTSSGYSATIATDTVTLVAPDELGISINTGEAAVAFVGTGTSAGTPTQFTSGVGSFWRIMHYHISEFFRMQPKGVLYVAIYAEKTYDGAEIQTVQNYANGEIRQIGIYLNDESFAASQASASQTYTALLRADFKPLLACLHADITSAALATLSNLSSLSASDVTVNIAEDGNFLQSDYSNTTSYVKGEKANWSGKIYITKTATTGNAPFNSDYWSELVDNLRDISGFSISTLGNQLGTIALAKVNESIAWVEKFPLNAGNTLDVAGFGTGDLYADVATGQLNSLNDYHYIFNRKFVGKVGTWNNDSYTAISQSSDFATIENNRTLDKAERGVRDLALDKLNSPLFVNSDGTLTDDTIETFKTTVEQFLIQMERDEEISGYSVEIDPDQDVLATSTLIITMRLLPTGVARQIQINSGFTTQIV